MSCEPLKCEFKINVPKKENYLNGVEINPDYKAFFEDNIFNTDYEKVLGFDTNDGIIYNGVFELLSKQSCNDTCGDIWALCPEDQEDKTYIEDEEDTDEDEYEEDTNEIPRANTLRKSFNRVTLIQKPCNQLKYYAVQELKSTAYMLRVITQSVIGKGNIKFNITVDIGQLTGRWKEDNKFIIMNDAQKNGRGKLIMGFGPSAAGKSYMAEKIVDIMHKTDPSFPTFFLNIDGGNYRQYSAVYQRVLSVIKYNVIDARSCYIGIENLKKSINTSKIKKNVMDYLIRQRDKNKQLQINLYVPDTLTSCDLKFGCMKKIKKYLDITQSHNEWIASMIYQHETGDTCPFKEGYKCLGTTTSGLNREKCESKKYEGGQNYKKGYKLGNKYLQSATYSNEDKPNYMIRIHNTNDLSGKNKSIFEDLSEYENDQEGAERIGKIAQAVSMNSFKYINNKVKYNPACKTISTVCEVNNLFDKGKYKKIKYNNDMILSEICPTTNNIEACLDKIVEKSLYKKPVLLFNQMYDDMPEEEKSLYEKPVLFFDEMYNDMPEEEKNESNTDPDPDPDLDPVSEQSEEEDSTAGGRKHKKTKKRRRTRRQKNRNKKKTRKFKRVIRKRTIKKKRYA